MRDSGRSAQLFCSVRRSDRRYTLPAATEDFCGVGWLPMFKRTVLSVLVGLGCFSGTSAGQQASGLAAGMPTSSITASGAGLEFPVVLQQKLVAGRTPVGTHIQSNLVVATLVSGKVVPRNAVFSGEVIESKAKTSSDPSRLSVRLNSAQWKNGSARFQVYLTSRYYPVTLEAGPNLQYGPEQTAKKTWNGMGQYPDNSPTYRPFPAAAGTKDEPADRNPSSTIARRPVTMKDVECQRDSLGGFTLVGNRSNIKLDKLTTYIFASSELADSDAK